MKTLVIAVTLFFAAITASVSSASSKGVYGGLKLDGHLDDAWENNGTPFTLMLGGQFTESLSLEARVTLTRETLTVNGNPQGECEVSADFNGMCTELGFAFTLGARLDLFQALGFYNTVLRPYVFAGYESEQPGDTVGYLNGRENSRMVHDASERRFVQAVGLDFVIGKAWSIRAEYSLTDIGDDADFEEGRASVGLKFKF